MIVPQAGHSTTGLILTMDRRPSAVLSRIFPAGMTPWMAQLWGHSANGAVLVVRSHAGHGLARKPPLSGSRGPDRVAEPHCSAFHHSLVPSTYIASVSAGVSNNTTSPI
jgi:hypothetical protein